MTDKEFKEKLKKLNLSQKEYAQIIGVSEDTTKSWYTKVSMPYWSEYILNNMEELQTYKKIVDGFVELNKFISKAN
jgi:DNA-binding transcriptional regulator YiaG